MQEQSNMLLDEAPIEQKVRNPKISIDVLIDDISCNALLLRLDEDARPIQVPKRGIKIREMTVPYAKLELTEKKALEYNLI